MRQISVGYVQTIASREKEERIMDRVYLDCEKRKRDELTLLLGAWLAVPRELPPPGVQASQASQGGQAELAAAALRRQAVAAQAARDREDRGEPAASEVPCHQANLVARGEAEGRESDGAE